MAVSDEKPTAVHFALIAFVTLSVIMAIATYAFHRESMDRLYEISRLSAENVKLNSAVKTLEDENKELRTKIESKNTAPGVETLRQ